jgi:hypothetical protein
MTRLAELQRDLADTMAAWAGQQRDYADALDRVLTTFSVCPKVSSTVGRRPHGVRPVPGGYPAEVQGAGSDRPSRRRELEPELGSPGEARALIRAACLAWGVDDGVRDDAELVVSELVANVVDHAGTRCTLDVSKSDEGLLIEVRDFYSCPSPQARPVDPLARRGRGLQVVAAVSSRWGVTPFPDGKSVWALLPRASPTTVLHLR